MNYLMLQMHEFQSYSCSLLGIMQADFPSLESLIARIHEDGRIAEKALDLPLYAPYKDLPYLTNPLPESNSQL
jgi:hypothetical protein